MNYYDENADCFAESTLNVDMSDLYEEFCAYLKNGASVLDAGCGPGRDIKEFLRRGYSIDAFDKSKRMVNIAKSKTGINVKCSTFKDFDSSKKYDGIWCCASLLHVPMQDLELTIKKLVKSLNEDGVIYMSFKYGKGERSKDGRLFTDLTEKSLFSMASKVDGLEEIKAWKSNDVRPGRSDIWLNAIYKKA